MNINSTIDFFLFNFVDNEKSNARKCRLEWSREREKESARVREGSVIINDMIVSRMMISLKLIFFLVWDLSGKLMLK